MSMWSARWRHDSWRPVEWYRVCRSTVMGVSVRGGGRCRLRATAPVSASLVAVANDVEAHRRAADQLAAEVDARVRERLAVLGVDLVGRLGGRRSLPEMWLRSLTSLDPWLPESTDAVKATALASEIADWVRGALAGIGMVTVQLRVVEPAGLPGIVMPGSPTPSDTGYRQEYQRGAAEDMGQIVDVANGVVVTRDSDPARTRRDRGEDVSRRGRVRPRDQDRRRRRRHDRRADRVPLHCDRLLRDRRGLLRRAVSRASRPLGRRLGRGPE